MLVALEGPLSFSFVTYGSKNDSHFCSENCSYSQITVLVAAEGVYKLPSINGSGDLKEALQKLGSISANKILVRTETFPDS